MRSALVSEFRLVQNSMLDEEDVNRKLYWYSATYAIVSRVMNFDYDPSLQFLHFMLQTSYNAFKQRAVQIATGDETILLPSDFFDRSAHLIGKIADAIELNEPFYDILQTLSNLIYLTSGNGYFQSLKGIEVAPRLIIFYRKKIDSDIWHWCTNCSDWPDAPVSYTERQFKKGSKIGELCRECLANEGAETCIAHEYSRS